MSACALSGVTMNESLTCNTNRDNEEEACKSTDWHAQADCVRHFDPGIVTFFSLANFELASGRCFLSRSVPWTRSCQSR